MAYHRTPQPHRPYSSLLLISTLPKTWTHHAPPVRLKTLLRRLLRRRLQSLPQNPRRQLLLPTQNHRRKVHNLQLLRYAGPPYGPHWRRARKICFTQLLSQKSIESYEYIRKEEMKTMFNELFISSGKPVLLKDYLYALNLNIISRLVLGKKYVKKGHSGFMSWEEFRDLVDEFF